MPRARHAMGRPGTAVIPADWQATHRPVVNQFHTVPVLLFHPIDEKDDDALEWDPAIEQMMPAPREPFWQGMARLQALRDLGGTRETAGDQVAVVAYQVTITATTDIAVGAGDTVRIDPSYADDPEHDPQLIGKAVPVDEVVRGSLRFERLLYGQLVDDAPG